MYTYDRSLKAELNNDFLHQLFWSSKQSNTKFLARFCTKYGKIKLFFASFIGLPVSIYIDKMMDKYVTVQSCGKYTLPSVISRMDPVNYFQQIFPHQYQ